MFRKFLFRRNTSSFLKLRRLFSLKLIFPRACSSGKPAMTAGGVDYHDFPKEEENILELWDKLDAFQSCLRQSKDKPRL